MSKKVLLRVVVLLTTFWILLMVAVYFANLKYRDRAISLLKSYLDESIQTEIRVRKENIHLSVLKKFPYASIDLYDILIKSAPGPDYKQITFYGKDTLLYAKRISLEFNLMSILTKKYELNKIQIDKASLYILLDNHGVGNYSLLKPSGNENKNSSFNIDLRKIQLNDVILKYIDYNSTINFAGLIDAAKLSGILSTSDFLFKVQITSEDCRIDVQNTNYLRNQTINFNAEISKKNQIFSLRNCDLNLSGLKLTASGQYDKNKKYYNFTINSRNAVLQNLSQPLFAESLSKIYLSPLKGFLKIDASLSGHSGFGLPFITAKFEINNGFFNNSEKKIHIEKFYAKGIYTNGIKRSFETSAIEIDSISAVSGKSEVFLRGKIENFNSPFFSVRLRSNFELEKLSAIESIKKRFELTGFVNSIFSISGSLPSINSFKSPDLDKLSMNGILVFKDILVKPLVGPLPLASMSGKITLNNFHFINLENIIIHTGQSNLKINGSVANIPVFITEIGQVPVYRCNVECPELHIEDFIIKKAESKSLEQSTSDELPDSIVIFANLKADKLFFGKFESSDVNGNIQYQSKVIHITGLSMKSREGTILSDNNITQDAGFYTINTNATIQNADIKDLFYSFNNFGQTVIVSDNLAGRLSGLVHVTAVWDRNFDPVYNRLNLQSEIEINKGEIVNYEPLLGLSKFIKVDELKHIYFDQLRTTINVQQETVYISQTDIHSSAISLTGSGEHHFNNNYIYRLQVQLSDVLWNKAKKKKPENTEFGYEVDDGQGRTTLPLKIKGRGTDFEVSYDLHTAGTLFFDKFRKEKKEAHKLFTPNDSTFSSQENPQENKQQRIEWNDGNEEGQKQKKEKKNNNRDDYSIEWKDE
jgi:hypothetical protein